MPQAILDSRQCGHNLEAVRAGGRARPQDSRGVAHSQTRTASPASARTPDTTVLAQDSRRRGGVHLTLTIN